MRVVISSQTSRLWRRHCWDTAAVAARSSNYSIAMARHPVAVDGVERDNIEVVGDWGTWGKDMREHHMVLHMGNGEHVQECDKEQAASANGSGKEFVGQRQGTERSDSAMADLL